VLLQLVCRKDVFLLGPLLRRIVVLSIKRVHNQGPIDFDRFGIIFAVEEDPASETTHRGLSRLVQDGIRPERHNTCRWGQFVVLVLPGKPHFVQVQRCTSTDSQSRDEKQYEHGQRLDLRSDHLLGSFHEFGAWGP
jgi:hypothetical protein